MSSRSAKKTQKEAAGPAGAAASSNTKTHKGATGAAASSNIKTHKGATGTAASSSSPPPAALSKVSRSPERPPQRSPDPHQISSLITHFLEKNAHLLGLVGELVGKNAREKAAERGAKERGSKDRGSKERGSKERGSKQQNAKSFANRIRLFVNLAVTAIVEVQPEDSLEVIGGTGAKSAGPGSKAAKLSDSAKPSATSPGANLSVASFSYNNNNDNNKNNNSNKLFHTSNHYLTPEGADLLSTVSDIESNDLESTTSGKRLLTHAILSFLSLSRARFHLHDIIQKTQSIASSLDVLESGITSIQKSRSTSGSESLSLSSPSFLSSSSSPSLSFEITDAEDFTANIKSLNSILREMLGGVIQNPYNER